MHYIALLLHSYTRWAVLLSLLFALYRSYAGWAGDRAFTTADHRARVLAVTISHTQLLLGFWLYFISPLLDAYWSWSDGDRPLELTFFGILHLLLMSLAIGVLTVGSAAAKRARTDGQKFRLLAIYFSVALLLILVAVPWPFSPLAARPWFRPI